MRLRGTLRLVLLSPVVAGIGFGVGYAGAEAFRAGRFDGTLGVLVSTSLVGTLAFVVRQAVGA